MRYTLDTTLDAKTPNAMEVVMVNGARMKSQFESIAIKTDIGTDLDTECFRCGGLMVVDHCFDVLGDAGEIDCKVFRCIQCGDVVDPVILRHRTDPPALAPKKHVKWSSKKLAALGYR